MYGARFQNCYKSSLDFQSLFWLLLMMSTLIPWFECKGFSYFSSFSSSACGLQFYCVLNSSTNMHFFFVWIKRQPKSYHVNYICLPFFIKFLFSIPPFNTDYQTDCNVLCFWLFVNIYVSLFRARRQQRSLLCAISYRIRVK